MVGFHLTGLSLHMLFWSLMAFFSLFLEFFGVKGIRKEGVVEEVFLWS